jgi:hypothetical protein
VAGLVLLTLEQGGLESEVDAFGGGLDTDGLMGSIAMGQPNCISIVRNMDEMRQIGLMSIYQTSAVFLLIYCVLISCFAYHI